MTLLSGLLALCGLTGYALLRWTRRRRPLPPGRELLLSLGCIALEAAALCLIIFYGGTP